MLGAKTHRAFASRCASLDRADYEAAWRRHQLGEATGLRDSPRDAAEVYTWLSDGRARYSDMRTKVDGERANQRDCE
jgi:hypothetical protein